MATIFRALVPKNMVPLLFLLLILFPLPVNAQLEPAPHPLDTFLTGILDFHDPTGIRGSLRYIDKEEKIIWLDWTQRSDDRPLFNAGWTWVPGEATLAVHPTDPTQFDQLQQIPKGTAIEMVIQLDQDGQRRILSYQDLSLPPKVPL